MTLIDYKVAEYGNFSLRLIYTHAMLSKFIIDILITEEIIKKGFVNT